MHKKNKVTVYSAEHSDGKVYDSWKKAWQAIKNKLNSKTPTDIEIK